MVLVLRLDYEIAALWKRGFESRIEIWRDDEMSSSFQKMNVHFEICVVCEG